jgi:hypothetical protein
MPPPPPLDRAPTAGTSPVARWILQPLSAAAGGRLQPLRPLAGPLGEVHIGQLETRVPGPDGAESEPRRFIGSDGCEERPVPAPVKDPMNKLAPRSRQNELRKIPASEPRQSPLGWASAAHELGLLRAVP